MRPAAAGAFSACSVPGIRSILTDRTVRSKRADGPTDNPDPRARASARGRLDAARDLVRRRRRARARTRAHLLARVDVRRALRVGGRAGLLLRGTHRSRAGRRRARLRRRPPRARERLPPPRASRRRGHRLSRDAAVPVSRLDVRPRRDVATRSALGARARLRPLRAVAGSRLRRHVGPVRLREPRSRGGATRGRARQPARDRRRERARRRRHPLPLAPRVADRGELEGRHGELPRVLPLPDGASGVQQGDRRQPRLVPAAGAPHLLEPDRPRPRVRARGQRQGAVRAARRRHAVAVPLPLPVDDAEHRAGHSEHLAGALPARRSPANGGGDGLLLRDRRVGRGDRRAHDLGQPGRRGGRLARAVGAARPRLGRSSARSAHGREREAHRRLPAPRHTTLLLARSEASAPAPQRLSSEAVARFFERLADAAWPG